MKHVVGYISTAVGSFISGVMVGNSFKFLIAAGAITYLLSGPMNLVSAYVTKRIELSERRMEIEATLESKRLDAETERWSDYYARKEMGSVPKEELQHPH